MDAAPSMNAEQVRNIVLGQIIAQLRVKRELDQQAFAREMGMAQSSVSRLERGQSSLDWQMFERAATTLDLTPEELKRLVAEAEARTERIIRETAKLGGSNKPSRGMDWWQTALLVAGVIGLIALVTYAVAALLNEQDDD